MYEVLIYKLVNRKWKYVTKTRFYNDAKEICEELNKNNYDAKITKPNGDIIKYYMLE